MRLRATSKISDFTRDSSLLLEVRWLRLGAQAQETGGALGHESGQAAILFPDKTATYPVEYGERAGELIARAVRSLRPTLRQKRRTLVRPQAK